jgi:hypothetical protein
MSTPAGLTIGTQTIANRSEGTQAIADRSEIADQSGQASTTGGQ